MEGLMNVIYEFWRKNSFKWIVFKLLINLKVLVFGKYNLKWEWLL